MGGAFGGDAAIAQALGEGGELFGGTLGYIFSGLARLQARRIGEDSAEDVERRKLAVLGGYVRK